MYPEQDLGPAERRLRCFWNSTGEGRKPTRPNVGTPTADMRHARSKSPTTTVTSGSSTCATPDNRELPPSRTASWDYLVMAAQSMVNQPTTPVRGMLSILLVDPTEATSAPERMRRRPTRATLKECACFTGATGIHRRSAHPPTPRTTATRSR